MKVINTCLFSEAHEANVLEIKLNCETLCMDEWIFIQSPYSFRGEYKGVCLEELLKEERFNPFKERIHIITIEENLFDKVGREHSEAGYFQVEHHSRMACSDYIFSKYTDDTRVVVGDIDELIDFSSSSRRDEFFRLCNQTDKDLQLIQNKMWWNFNNFSAYPKHLPVRTISSLKQGWKYFRNEGCDTAVTDQLLSMEYSYCFDLAGNIRKTSTFSHDRYRAEHLERAFFLNSWHKRDHEQLGQAWDFFETIELNPDNSPQYVLDNFDRLDTKTINPDYAEARVRMLGMHYPHPTERVGMLGNNKIDRRYHYMRRNK